MKIEKLTLGGKYKYKELCELLEIKPTSRANNSRMAQFKELDTCCKFHKEGEGKGQVIVIDEIYESKGEKVDLRKIIKEDDKRKLGNNSEQAKYVRYLMCNLLSKYELEKDEVIGFSKGLLLRKINLINENYVTAKVKRDEYAKELNVEPIAIDECIDYVDNKSISSIKKAIQVLVGQKVLGYKYSYTWVGYNGKHNHTNVFEHNAIMEAEFEVMEQMKIRNKGKIFEYGRWNEFKSKVKTNLLENYSNLFNTMDFYYASFHFHYNIEQLKKHMKYMEEKQDVNLELAILGVQKAWDKSLDVTINNRHIKAIEEVNLGSTLNETRAYRKRKKYIREQTKVKNSITKQECEPVKISEQLKINLDNLEVPF